MAPMIPLDNYLKQDFTAGVHEVILRFDGTDIYNSAKNGPYAIEIIIYDESYSVADKTVHTTAKYSYEDFNPTTAFEPSTNNELSVVNNTIKLTTDTFVAVIYELTPQIVFYYKSDNGETAKFKITYSKVLCFYDKNGDTKYEEDELKYWGDLKTSHWSSPKELFENFNNFEFSVQTIVELLDNAGNTIDTKLELEFHYSSLTKSKNAEAGRKFDINIKVLGSPLNDVSHISLEHILEAEIGTYEFLSVQGSSYDKISFMTNANKEQGYYGWDKSILRTEKNGQSDKFVSNNIQQTTEESKIRLYLNYPYSMDTLELFHDPEVGVNPENEPREKNIEPNIISHNRWFIIYLAVALVVATVMIGNVYFQKRKREQ